MAELPQLMRVQSASLCWPIQCKVRAFIDHSSPFLHLAFTVSLSLFVPVSRLCSLPPSAGYHHECSANQPATLHCHSRHLRWRALRWNDASSQTTLPFSPFPFSLHNRILVDRGKKVVPSRRYSISSLLKHCWINSGVVDANRSLSPEDAKQSSSATITITAAPTLNTWQRLIHGQKRFQDMHW